MFPSGDSIINSVSPSLLNSAFSTISLGYAGLWECVYALNGKKLTEPEGEELGLSIMQHMNDKCAEWNEELYLGFGIYGTPLESTTYKFAKCLQKRYGEIPGVTDKNYMFVNDVNGNTYDIVGVVSAQIDYDIVDKKLDKEKLIADRSSNDAKRDTSHLHLEIKENKKLYLNEYMENRIYFL